MLFSKADYQFFTNSLLIAELRPRWEYEKVQLNGLHRDHPPAKIDLNVIYEIYSFDN